MRVQHSAMVDIWWTFTCDSKIQPWSTSGESSHLIPIFSHGQHLVNLAVWVNHQCSEALVAHGQTFPCESWLFSHGQHLVNPPIWVEYQCSEALAAHGWTFPCECNTQPWSTSGKPSPLSPTLAKGSYGLWTSVSEVLVAWTGLLHPRDREGTWCIVLPGIDACLTNQAVENFLYTVALLLECQSYQANDGKTQSYSTCGKPTLVNPTQVKCSMDIVSGWRTGGLWTSHLSMCMPEHEGGNDVT
jgi:hypothetical protein